MCVFCHLFLLATVIVSFVKLFRRTYQKSFRSSALKSQKLFVSMVPVFVNMPATTVLMQNVFYSWGGLKLMAKKLEISCLGISLGFVSKPKSEIRNSLLVSFEENQINSSVGDDYPFGNVGYILQR